MVGSPVWSLGLMSGTSLDGLDLALLLTDGGGILQHGAWASVELPAALATDLHALMQGVGDALAVEQAYSLFVSECVNNFIQQQEIPSHQIAVIGFHGQTIVHRPEEGITWQLGNASLLTHYTEIAVVSDFRRRDMAAGGQGAPLVPLYHAALCASLPKPLAIVNIGGVANVTYIGEDQDSLLAFDTGTGCALLNDWISTHTGDAYDIDGDYASAGVVNQGILDTYLADECLLKLPPKSLDRNHFSLKPLQECNVHDGAATLTALSVEAIARAAAFFPQPPTQWLICGGGRHNSEIMRQLKARLLQRVECVDSLGWRGDALEAEAFAYLAVRSLYGLPLSLPGTTGVARPVTGGVLSKP